MVLALYTPDAEQRQGRNADRDEDAGTDREEEERQQRNQ